MAERSTVAQVAQIGKEATPGTAVAATRRLGSLNISPSIAFDTSMFRPAGLKAPTVQAVNKEWSEFDLDGQPTYEEVIIPMSGALGAPTVAQVMDGATPTGVYSWTFQPSDSGAESPYTYTLENGQSGTQAEKFAHLLCTEFGLDISRSEIAMSGSAFGQSVTTGITPTAGLAIPATLTPILPGAVSVYLDSTSAALGTTRLNRVVSVAPKLGGRYNPAWFVDGSKPSFTTFVENGDGWDGTVDLTVEADTEGMLWVPRLRVGSTHFLRVEAVGPVLYNAGVQPNLTALFRWDIAVKVEDVDSFGDEDGVYGLPFSLVPVYDPTWGKSMVATVRNKIASL